jgi:hypothetical protein
MPAGSTRVVIDRRGRTVLHELVRQLFTHAADVELVIRRDPRNEIRR